ncbi:hypothetical protein HDU91_001112, partial [Kappamyces sp. JEL0680]
MKRTATGLNKNTVYKKPTLSVPAPKTARESAGPDAMSRAAAESVSLGLHPTLVSNLAHTDLYPWQLECLRLPSVLHQGRNLVFSAPTSAGKSLVGELVMVTNVLRNRPRKAIFILPFISIVVEKYASIQKLVQGLPLRVGAYYGNAPSPSLDDVDIAICTIEKANSLVNKLVQEQKLAGTISCIVVDEMHMLGSEQRGYLLELLLTKVLLVGMGELQVIGMSATVPNIDIVAKWLDATLFTTAFRPVQLQEFIKVGSKIFDTDGN